VFVASKTFIYFSPAEQTDDHIAAIALDPRMTLLFTDVALLCILGGHVTGQRLVHGPFEAVGVAFGMLRYASSADCVVAIETEETELLVGNSTVAVATHARAAAVGSGHVRREGGKCNGERQPDSNCRRRSWG
jgi:hypothetical protein